MKKSCEEVRGTREGRGYIHTRSRRSPTGPQRRGKVEQESTTRSSMLGNGVGWGESKADQKGWPKLKVQLSFRCRKKKNK